MLLHVWGKHSSITPYKFQVYNFILRHLYIVLCAHHLVYSPSATMHVTLSFCCLSRHQRVSNPRKASLAGSGLGHLMRSPTPWLELEQQKRLGRHLCLWVISGLLHIVSPRGLVGLPLSKQPQGSGTAYLLYQGSKLRCSHEQGGSSLPFPDLAGKSVSLLPHSFGQTVTKASPVSRGGNIDPSTRSRWVASKRRSKSV